MQHQVSVVSRHQLSAQAYHECHDRGDSFDRNVRPRAAAMLRRSGHWCACIVFNNSHAHYFFVDTYQLWEQNNVAIPKPTKHLNIWKEDTKALLKALLLSTPHLLILAIMVH